MATYLTVTPGTTITASWGNNVRDGLVTLFASAAARASAVLSPVTGFTTFLSGIKQFNTFDGANHVPVQANYVGGTTPRTANSAGVTTTETQVDAFTFTAIAGRRYRITWSGILANSVGSNNMELRIRYAAGASVTSAGTLIRGALSTSSGANINTPTTMVATFSSLPAGQVTIGAFLITTFGAGASTAVATATAATEFWAEDIGT